MTNNYKAVVEGVSKAFKEYLNATAKERESDTWLFDAVKEGTKEAIKEQSANKEEIWRG